MSASSFDSEDRNGVIRVARETDGIIAVCLEGDFDLANAPVLGDQVDLALETGKDLVLDLSEATFIDSSVINVLLRAAKAAGGREQSVVLQLGTAANVERVLEITRIEEVLPRAHDRQEAVRIIQQQAEGVFIPADVEERDRQAWNLPAARVAAPAASKRQHDTTGTER